MIHLFLRHLRFRPKRIRLSVGLEGTAGGKKARGDLSGQEQVASKTSVVDFDEGRDGRGHPSIPMTIFCCPCHDLLYCPGAGDGYCFGERSENPCENQWINDKYLDKYQFSRSLSSLLRNVCLPGH